MTTKDEAAAEIDVRAQNAGSTTDAACAADYHQHCACPSTCACACHVRKADAASSEVAEGEVKLLTREELNDIERFQRQRRKNPVPQDAWLYVAEIDRLLTHIRLEREQLENEIFQDLTDPNFAACATPSPVDAEKQADSTQIVVNILKLIDEDVNFTLKWDCHAKRWFAEIPWVGIKKSDKSLLTVLKMLTAPLQSRSVEETK
jgi:hypothetical protein